MNSFENHFAPDKGVSRLCMLNELDDSLLLVASSKLEAVGYRSFDMMYACGNLFAS